ncbi:MAG: hypothetical protein JNJ59_21960 [Deltaproteobacteria bacterium]|nr:hypothetical protein [Deltaproteobacteria bacterium]
MKIRKVVANERKAQLELTTFNGKLYPFPFARLEPQPSSHDKLAEVIVDDELGREAVTYRLASGAEGTVHLEQALDYNRDPAYLADLLVHKLSAQARRRADEIGVSRRELARRLRTSVPQLYRLLDPANTNKSLGQLISLLHILDCEVDLVVRPREVA